MSLTEKSILTRRRRASARQGHDIQVTGTQEPEVEIELMESEPTFQQRQAYERFWKMFIDRLVRERQAAR